MRRSTTGRAAVLVGAWALGCVSSPTPEPPEGAAARPGGVRIALQANIHGDIEPCG